MPTSRIHQCGCSRCRMQVNHPDREHHQRMNLLMNQLSHEQRRLYAAIESIRMGGRASH